MKIHEEYYNKPIDEHWVYCNLKDSWFVYKPTEDGKINILAAFDNREERIDYIRKNLKKGDGYGIFRSDYSNIEDIPPTFRFEKIETTWTNPDYEKIDGQIVRRK